jgi:hypothetical protein
MTFPEQSPFMFATVTSGPVKIFLSDRLTVIKEDLRLSDLTLGGGNIMLIEVDGVDTVHTRIAPLVKVVMSLRTQWFGMREFAIQDPDGYVITFAERDSGETGKSSLRERWKTQERLWIGAALLNCCKIAIALIDRSHIFLQSASMVMCVQSNGLDPSPGLPESAPDVPPAC